MSAEPTDWDLLVAEWDLSKAKQVALHGTQRKGYGETRGGLLTYFAEWACDAFGSTATLAAAGWTAPELSALLSTHQLGATPVKERPLTIPL